MRLVDLRNQDNPGNISLARAELDVAVAEAVVAPVLADVKARGEAAVLAAGEKFDGIRPASLRVPTSVLTEAWANLDPQVRQALETAIERVRRVHASQIREGHITQVAPGAQVQQKWIPVDRVGLYVPGGRAVYPSSVVMNVVPAQIAGVQGIAVASPPQPDNNGWPHPVILAACHILGVTEVYAAGGAQAVALFAYGAELGTGERCEPVALVTGPGNIYVTAAKRALRGIIGIDSEAGPTEIMVIADETARASYVAADLISQAEHDVIAASVLVTTSVQLAEAVQQELRTQMAATKHAERIEQALTGQQSCIVLVDSVTDALAVANAYAAEHLEIQTREAASVADQIRNAGAIFVGDFTPVSLGDYAAGSNHVLPTGGCACHSAGLSVQTFLKSVQVVHYTAQALGDIADTVTTLAAAEDLPAHGAAITVRVESA